MVIIEENNKELIEKEIDNVTYENIDIKSLIYTIRGKQVMLDSDVAMLYHYETKNVNKAMKRNIERFPEDFCFQLTVEEAKEMWFQNGTTSEKDNIKYRSEKYLPYVYTEQGIAMLSGILRNDIAVKVSINIMKAFIEMRKFLSNNEYIFERFEKIEYKLLKLDNKFNQTFNEFQKNKERELKQQIFFNGQIYDAYSLIIDIIKSAKTNKFHDRFIVIDNKELYHIGASLKDLGKKCFAISKIEDEEYINRLDRVV